MNQTHKTVLRVANWIITAVTFILDPLLGIVFFVSDLFDEKPARHL